jgi:ABC-type dipeptide/oligopeptide/nickel transport system permease component
MIPTTTSTSRYVNGESGRDRVTAAIQLASARTGIQFGYLLGGSVIVEQIVALPGLGLLLLTSITNRDYAVVQSSVLVIAAGFVVINVIVDLAYRVIDPRTRA